MDELLDRHVKERLSGREMSAIIGELRDLGYAEEEIREHVVSIDDEVTRMQLIAAELSRANMHMSVGYVLIAVGVGLTVGVTFWMNAGPGGGHVLCYGAIVSGGFMVWRGWNERKRLAEERASPRRRFFQNR
jgi:hypothetical protein